MLERDDETPLTLAGAKANAPPIVVAAIKAVIPAENFMVYIVIFNLVYWYTESYEESIGCFIYGKATNILRKRTENTWTDTANLRFFFKIRRR